MGKSGKALWITRTACAKAWKNEGFVWVTPRNCMWICIFKKLRIHGK